MTHRTKGRALAAADSSAYQLLGIAIVALFPALFWTGVVAAVASATGHEIGAATLATVGAAIATFLFTAVMRLFARAG